MLRVLNGAPVREGAELGTMLHPQEATLILSIYADDFKMAGPSETFQKGWELLKAKMRLGEPTLVAKCLGCVRSVNESDRSRCAQEFK